VPLNIDLYARSTLVSLYASAAPAVVVCPSVFSEPVNYACISVG